MVFGTKKRKFEEKPKDYTIKEQTEVSWMIGEYFWVKVDKKGRINMADNYLLDIISDNTPAGDQGFDAVVLVLREAKKLSKERQEAYQKQQEEKKARLAAERAARASSTPDEDEEEFEDEEDGFDEDEDDEY